MSWVTVTINDLKDLRVASWIDALRTTALDLGQDEPTEEMIETAVFRIRAEIATNLRNVLDANPTTVPPELKELTCRMVIRQMQARLMVPLSEDERQQYVEDLEYLDRIAMGKVSVTPPTGEAVLPMVSVSQAFRKAYLEMQEGL